MTREITKVDAAEVASSLTPVMVRALLLKVLALALALKALALLALLAPSVAKADRKTTLDLDELTPS